MKYNQLPTPARRIRITESDLRCIVEDVLDEYNDWRAQMLVAQNQYQQNPGRAQQNVQRANNIANAQYGLNNTNNAQMGRNYGRGEQYKPSVNLGVEMGNVTSPQGVSADYQSPRVGGGYYGNGGVDYTKDGFVMPAEVAQQDDLQQKTQNDMMDFYSDNYKKRLQQKKSQLGNAQSGQDFTPSALKESIRRAVRRFLR